MLIDCDTCTAGPRACGDCIVTHLLAAPRLEHRERPEPWRGGTTDLTEDEVVAVGVLAAGGLVPPLRLVTAEGPAVEGAPGTSERVTGRGDDGLGTGVMAG